jgi:hypothetical protein
MVAMPNANSASKSAAAAGGIICVYLCLTATYRLTCHYDILCSDGYVPAASIFSDEYGGSKLL